jgi:dsRNA-specific ribonuclease
LYNAGLLNDNLLPLSKAWELEDTQLGEFPATVEVSTQFSPWAELAESWLSPNLHQTRISVRDLNEENDLSMVLTIPSPIPAISSFPLYWDETTTFSVQFEDPLKVSLGNSDTLRLLQSITHVLNRSPHSDHNKDSRMDFIALFSPNLEEEQLAAWHTANYGRIPALEQFNAGVTPHGFIRTPSLHGIPHMFSRWKVLDAEHGGTVEIECEQVPRRRNFLVRNTLSKRRKLSEDQTTLSTLQAFPSKDCTIDRLPFEYARFNMFIPAILRHVEARMVADKLCNTILKEVPIKGAHHIVTAISAPSANWVTDYQRYEFFGDTLLKFTVSYQLFCDHENWHEGYLSEQRNRMVSNQWLAKAALSKGLDAFIMTEAVKGKSYSPMFVSEVNSHSSGKRIISTKVVADVVEALIGAAYVDGGFHTARACIHTFLPEIHIEPPQLGPTFSNSLHGVAVTRAESVIGHQFRNKTLLLEALTHPSCERDIQTESYQRLEFLGDSVLDYVVVSFLTEHQKQLSQGRMTQIKGALVNVHFLGFLCLAFSHEQKEVISIQEQPGRKFREKIGMEQVYLWQIMRQHNPEIVKMQSACLERYKGLKTEIRHALDKGQTYPWVQLSKLNLDKFYSDMIESLMGAIFVDSKGDFAECRRFATRIGLIPYLERLVATEIDLSHPRTTLMRLAGSDSVNYVTKQERSSADGDINHHQCTVTVDGVEVAEVKGCLSKDEAIVVGAYEATAKLKMKKRGREASGDR